MTDQMKADVDEALPPAAGDALLVEKLASRIRAWDAQGVCRTAERQALDYIEFVQSHSHPSPVHVDLEECARAYLDYEDDGKAEIMGRVQAAMSAVLDSIINQGGRITYGE